MCYSYFLKYPIHMFFLHIKFQYLVVYVCNEYHFYDSICKFTYFLNIGVLCQFCNIIFYFDKTGHAHQKIVPIFSKNYTLKYISVVKLQCKFFILSIFDFWVQTIFVLKMSCQLLHRRHYHLFHTKISLPFLKCFDEWNMLFSSVNSFLTKFFT